MNEGREKIGLAVTGMAGVLAAAFAEPERLAGVLAHAADEKPAMALDIKAVRELTSAIKDLAGTLEGGDAPAGGGVIVLPEAALNAICAAPDPQNDA